MNQVIKLKRYMHMKHNAFALSMNPASCTVDFILAQTMTRIRQGCHTPPKFQQQKVETLVRKGPEFQ